MTQGMTEGMTRGLPMLIGTLSMPALTLVGWQLGGAWQWLGAIYPLLVHPILDPLSGTVAEAPRSRTTPWDDLLLWISMPVQCVILLTALHRMAPEQFWSSAICCGMSAGVYGVTSAHELIHRARRRERELGLAQLLQCGFAHFRIEHLYIHHRLAATKHDPATARRGESLYAYWLRALPTGWWKCWAADRRMLRDQALQLLVLIAVGASFGREGLLLFGVQSLIAMLLLSAVDYLEHYGLERLEMSSGKFEPFGPAHAWEARERLSNLTLFNLGLHPSHHIEARTPYPELKAIDASPRLPFGYSAALLAALIPPIWKKIIHPLLDRH